MAVLDEVGELLRSLRGVWDEDAVDELEHALQAAARARDDGADDELVLAAAFHDDLGYLSHVPVLHLALAVIGLPLAATAAGWLLAGREPPAIARPVIGAGPRSPRSCGTSPSSASSRSSRSPHSKRRSHCSAIGGSVPTARICGFALVRHLMGCST